MVRKLYEKLLEIIQRIQAIVWWFRCRVLGRPSCYREVWYSRLSWCNWCHHEYYEHKFNNPPYKSINYWGIKKRR